MKKSLCVMLYHNPTDEVRGKTRRYLYEIKPNVFVGTVSASVRAHLWNAVENTGTEASLIYSDTNEQGFSVKNTSENMNRFIQLTGIFMPYSNMCTIAISDLYAKPSKKLLNHLLEAGAVAEALLRNGRGYVGAQTMVQRFDISMEELISSICFLCALHDIGKAHPGFQKHLAQRCGEDVCDSVLSLMLRGMIVPEDETIRHERYSSEIIYNYFTNCGMNKDAAKDYTTIISYHHQGKGKGQNFCDRVERYRSGDDRWREWNSVQLNIISEVEKHWRFSPQMLEIVEENGINGLAYMILSVMVTADWIVSGAQWNRYLGIGIKLKDAARDFVEQNMLSYIPIKKVFEGIGWNDAFSFPMNTLQKTISEVDCDYTDLTLIEYPCGYGKTEAALLAALKFGNNKSGIYVAAPTMATAKGLAKRCQNLANKVGLNITIPELDSSMIWSCDDMNKISKELWTSRTRHQFLYPFAVGTVDQAIKSIISYRYSCIGMLGLSDKVLIIDEVHAYDSYMRTELKDLIRWCRFLKVPVILLSATLPTNTKTEFFRAAGYNENSERIETAYPMISMIKDKKLVQISPECNGHIMPVSCIKSNNLEQIMYEQAVRTTEGCMALIVPTIDEAFSLYHRLQNNITDCEVMIFHGRDTVAGKTRKTDKLLQMLGKERNNRPKKMIVVATSIIEQSLDVDFDYMITALAPIDLLIQRIGRVWRHDDLGTIREHKRIDNPFVVVIPEEYGKLEFLYNKTILNDTERIIQSVMQIDTVADIRGLIDNVYGEKLFPKDARSQTEAGRIILDTPFRETITILADEEEIYRKFDRVAPSTREETYPTVQIAILEELKESYTYEEIQRIMQENVISVGETRIEGFKSIQTDAGYFDDMKIFVGDGFVIRNDTECMLLTDDGLEFI